MRLNTPPPSPPHQRPHSKAGAEVKAQAAHPLSFQARGREIHVSACNVEAIGLRGFVVRVMQELSLTMAVKVDFNMNSNAIIGTWEDVFLAERCYTTVLGISSRVYRCFSFTHEPERNLCYLILEEENRRSLPFLPDFQFKAMVICWYNAQREVTAVQVEYDQLSFYMHCLGLHAAHQWLTRRVITPAILTWAKAYVASGVVHPLTFLLQVAFFTFCFLRLFVTTNVGQCCLSCSSS